MWRRLHLLGLLLVVPTGCATATTQGPEPAQAGPAPVVELSEIEPLFPDPFPSTYKPFPSRTTLIRNATVFTGTG